MTINLKISNKTPEVPYGGGFIPEESILITDFQKEDEKIFSVMRYSFIDLS